MSTEQEPESTLPTPKRDRSANFPGLSLEDAIERAKLIFAKHGRRPVPLAGVAEIWECSPKSSGLLKWVAALGYYGLLEGEGSGDNRKLLITREAERIIENAPNAGELLKSAALRPRLFGETWTKYEGKIPSEDTLRSELRWDEQFKVTKENLDLFITNFKDTIAFAKLEEFDIIPQADEDKEVEAKKDPTPKLPAKPSFKPVSIGGIMHSSPIVAATYSSGLSSGQIHLSIEANQITSDDIDAIKDWFEYLKKHVPRSLSSQIADIISPSESTLSGEQ